MKKYILQGGVFANVILSHKIHLALNLKVVNVVPYMGDEGSGIGAAVLSSINNGEDPSKLKNVSMPYLGDSYSSEDTLEILKNYSDSVTFENLKDTWFEQASKALKENKIIGTFLKYGVWSQGFGPKKYFGQSSFF